MAAISVTPAKVRRLEGSTVRRYKAGYAGAAPGDDVYVDGNGVLQKAGAASTAAVAQARGILSAIGVFGAISAAVGDMCEVVVHGPVTGFDSMTPGVAVFVDDTAGKMNETAPAAQGHFKFALGYTESDVTIFVQPQLIVPTANP